MRPPNISGNLTSCSCRRVVISRKSEPALCCAQPLPQEDPCCAASEECLAEECARNEAMLSWYVLHSFAFTWPPPWLSPIYLTVNVCEADVEALNLENTSDLQ